jgi:hypothetical protein
MLNSVSVGAFLAKFVRLEQLLTRLSICAIVVVN